MDRAVRGVRREMEVHVTTIRSIIALSTLAILGALAGCGGDYSAVNENHEGTLADSSATTHSGRTCDSYEVSVGRGWHVTAAMTSEFDNYLYLARGNEDVASNDDSDGFNARIDTDVEMAGTYTVYACAYSADRGDYTLQLTTAEGS